MREWSDGWRAAAAAAAVCQICYGTTENSPVTFQSSPDDSLERRVSTVGSVHPFVEVFIISLKPFVVQCAWNLYVSF